MEKLYKDASEKKSKGAETLHSVIKSLLESISIQLEYLFLVFSKLLTNQNKREESDPSELNILVWFKHESDATSEHCQLVMSLLVGNFQETSRLFAEKFRITVKFESAAAKELVDKLTPKTHPTQSRGNSVISLLLNDEVESAWKNGNYSPDFTHYTLRNKQFLTYNKNLVSLSEIGRVIDIVRSYFPNQNWKHYVVPDLDRIPETLLDKLDELDNPESKIRLAKNATTGHIIGELKLFWEKLAPKTGKFTGIFLKSWNNDNLLTLLDEWELFLLILG